MKLTNNKNMNNQSGGAPLNLLKELIPAAKDMVERAEAKRDKAERDVRVADKPHLRGLAEKERAWGVEEVKEMKRILTAIENINSKDGNDKEAAEAAELAKVAKVRAETATQLLGKWVGLKKSEAEAAAAAAKQAAKKGLDGRGKQAVGWLVPNHEKAVELANVTATQHDLAKKELKRIRDIGQILEKIINNPAYEGSEIRGALAMASEAGNATRIQKHKDTIAKWEPELQSRINNVKKESETLVITAAKSKSEAVAKVAEAASAKGAKAEVEAKAANKAREAKRAASAAKAAEKSNEEKAARALKAGKLYRARTPGLADPRQVCYSHV